MAKINKLANKFVWLKSTLKNNAPNNRQITLVMAVNKKSQIEIPMMISGILVGVASIASNVPRSCSSLILEEKLCKAVLKYPEKAMPTRTKGKYHV